MKKKILFIIPNLKSGGAEKSLVTLLQLFDYDKYDVSLFMFRREGLFLEHLPYQVRILDAGENYRLFDGDSGIAIKSFIKKGRFDLAFARFLYAKSLKNPDGYKREVDLWKQMKRTLNYPKEHYDCVIGYLEGPSNWLAEEIDAAKKIGYLHIYLDKTSLNKENFIRRIKSFDEFITVSPECKENIKKSCSDYENVHLIHNIISPSFINKASDGDGLPDEAEIKLLTVGRLAYQKGLEYAVDACKILKDKGYDIKWYHIGVGEEKNNVTARIKSKKLDNTFILLGEKANPYPYIKSCDIYVQPSRNEGKSIAIDEAKCLHKPIVVTNFPSVYDQIQDGINGLICEMDAKSVADAIEKLILNKQLREDLSNNLAKEKIGNEEEIQKLYDLIES
ncbi:MAG: glycosyltransferase [Clostridia bacterium]|nr:glycosyltransferase [Clostridia bacterium]